MSVNKESLLLIPLKMQNSLRKLRSNIAETDYENDSPRRPAGDEGKNRAGDGTEGLSGPIPG